MLKTSIRKISILQIVVYAHSEPTTATNTYLLTFFLRRLDEPNLVSLPKARNIIHRAIHRSNRHYAVITLFPRPLNVFLDK